MTGWVISFWKTAEVQANRMKCSAVVCDGSLGFGGFFPRCFCDVDMGEASGLEGFVVVGSVGGLSRLDGAAVRPVEGEAGREGVEESTGREAVAVRWMLESAG